MTELIRANRDIQLTAAVDLCRMLKCWFGGINSQTDIANVDWDAVISLAVQTKTHGLLKHYIDNSETEVPKDISKNIRLLSDRISLKNFNNLNWMRKVLNLLEGVGIEAISYKGPLRSMEVYGAWNTRASSDIDLLVRYEDYDEARTVLINEGYIGQVPYDSRWWHKYLGESPYKFEDEHSPFVDLHHNVQQPGGPYPNNIEPFFETSNHKEVGGSKIRVLSPEYALLVCAISYGKARRAGQPWLIYAHEFRKASEKLNNSDNMIKYSRKLNLNRLLTDLSLVSQLIFGVEADDNTALKKKSPLLLSAFGIPEQRRFNRLRHLWAWTDGTGKDRVIPFINSVAKLYSSDLTRILENES